MMSSTPDGLGSVLVIGGCGFVGFHVVQSFLLEPACSSVSVMSRNPKRNRLPKVTYYTGDISDLATVRKLMVQINPTVVIHTACPSATNGSAKDYESTTIQGTQNLLQTSSEIESAKAFIFTSSATMAAGPEHVNLDESTPLADTCPSSHPYAKTKAQADRLVLEFNKAINKQKSGLRTACIRLPIVYGERDSLSVPNMLALLEKRQTNFQLGDGRNLWDFVSAENAATAHVLLAKALLAQHPAAPKVDGEAFNISDGQRHLFWDYPRTVWRAAGDKVKAREIWIVPTWLALMVADMMEWLFWLFTRGTRRPAQLSRQQVEYSCFTHTYSIEKSKERLGYQPALTPDFREGIHRAVAWSMERDGWGQRLEKRRKE